MKILTRNMEPIKLSSGNVEEVQQFAYLGSIVSTDGGTEEDVKARLGKARVAFYMLDKLWKSKIISRHTKLKIFNSNVKSVLLYGSETWRTTKQLQRKIQVFINNCLRRIFNINWKDKITNKELWNMQCWNWPERTGGGGSAAEMFEILPRDLNLKPIFTQK